MNCEKFNEIRVDLAQGKPIPAEQKSRALDHAGNCPACVALLQGEQRLGLALEKLRQNSSPLDPPQTNERVLLELYRKQQDSLLEKAPAAISVQNTPRQRTHWLLAVAAIIPLVVILLFFKAGHGPERSKGPALETNSALVEPQKSTPAVSAGLSPQPMALQSETHPRAAPTPQGLPGQKGSYNPKRTTTRNITSPAAGFQQTRNSEEIMTEFIEVTPGVEIYPQEVQQIVRVRMPRGNLARFGFPVNPERISEPVQTDLLMTQEGLVKAVRFAK